MGSCSPNLVKISETGAELWRFLFFQDGGQHISYRSKTALQTVHVYQLANFLTVRPPVAELLLFVKKFQMAVSAILNLYLAILRFWTTREVHLWT